ncbi:protein YgfX [Thioalkalicoccus limnaeus]|uniref:Protein YgfX n=1 Tax=Thioalkalicoccus limnaeus TaxID=120681 RepID=A0ABV4BDF9_9GAMM
MEHQRTPPLAIRPRLSWRLAGCLALLYGASVALVWLLPLPSWARIALTFVVCLDLVHQIGLHLGRWWPWAIREAIWLADGAWVVTLVSGRRYEARLAPTTFASVGLIVLNLRCGRFRYRALPLVADSLDPDLFRRLRVRLRFRALDRF